MRRRLAKWFRALAGGFLALMACRLAVLVIGVLWPTTAAPVQNTTTATVIAGAHPVDVAAGTTKDGLSVVVDGGRVLAVGPPSEVVPPATLARSILSAPVRLLRTSRLWARRLPRPTQIARRW
jgi:hypothetical protein